jgi:hypothetical protein
MAFDNSKNFQDQITWANTKPSIKLSKNFQVHLEEWGNQEHESWKNSKPKETTI